MSKNQLGGQKIIYFLSASYSLLCVIAFLMKNKSSQENPVKLDTSNCAGNYLSGQKASLCPSAAGLLTPADGQKIEYAGDKSFKAHDDRDGMAVSVTRHASTPLLTVCRFFLCRFNSLGKYELRFNVYIYAGRELSNTANILPNSLPEKDEQDQSIYSEVESGRESVQVWGSNLINKHIIQTIDQDKKEDYNPAHGKSDRIKGLIKEKNNESI